MRGFDWKIIAASVAGTSHVGRGEGCQDAFVCEVARQIDGEVLLIAVADGAGSAINGAAGARLAVEFWQNGLKVWLENNRVENLERAFATDFVRLWHYELTKRASSDGLNLSDYACTLLTAAVGATSAAFVQIGDGAIVFADETENYRLFTAPQQGEYANSTNFVTDENAHNNLQFESHNARIDQIAVFTDGLQRVALQMQPAATAHQPFFRSMFAPFVRADFDQAKLENNLRQFLDSPKINERTDDDKTLILAKI